MLIVEIFLWLISSTFQVVVLIGLIFMIKILVGKRLPLWAHHCLWAILILRMVLPWTPESRLSFFNLMPTSGRVFVQQLDKPLDKAGVVFSDLDSNSVGSIIGQREQQPGLKLLMIVWSAGVLLLMVRVLWENARFTKIISGKRPFTQQKILDFLEDCKKEVGVRTPIGIIATDHIKSPGVFGYLRPRLLIPEKMIEELSLEEMRAVFLHELAHIKHHDLAVRWIMSAVQILHWFNPLVWLAFYQMRIDQELAADATASACYGPDKSMEYAKSLVKIMDRQVKPRMLPGLIGVLESKSQMKRRIKMIVESKNYHIWGWALSLFLLVIFGLVMLTNANENEITDQTSNADRTTKTSIDLIIEEYNTYEPSSCQ